MKISAQQKRAMAAARHRHGDDRNVVSIGVGYKYQNGKRTGEIGAVIGVKKKLPSHEIPKPELVLSSYLGVATDVVEYGTLKPLVVRDIPKVEPRSLVKKRRPCPPGYSIGHALVTAGTLGVWVHVQGSDDWHILTNNHVAAASNDALEGDFIRQPGRADGGTDSDRIAVLTKYARIKFDSENGDKKKAASLAWRAWKWPANLLAKLLGCDYRLVVTSRAVEQNPNLVDAALAQVILPSYVDTEIPSIGELEGIRDFELGDKVQKTGRTTEYTEGTVEVVGASSRVDYGAGKGTATFEDQLIIRGDSGEFSAGGDSGSAIVGRDGMLGAILFAGGSGITVANRAANVVSLLGVHI